MEKINVLWTGGLDSSFRIFELSLQNVEIQPYYIVEERASEKYERNAIKKITDYIRRSQNTKAVLHDTIFIDKSSYKQSKNVHNSWSNLYSKYKIGSQYEYLANFALEYNLILEVGLESSPRSKAYNALTSEGVLKIEEIDGIQQYYIDQNLSSHDLNIVFGHLRFPKLLWESSKLEEVNLLNSWGGES